MKSNIGIKRGLVLGVASALLALSALASAGNKYDTSMVRIGSGWASGAIGAARASSDTAQDIGCDTVAYPGYSYVSCYATDTSYQRLSCTSSDPKMVAAVSNLEGFSYMQFNVDGNGNCTLLYFSNMSYYRPHTL